MSDAALRSGLIRLAHSRPDLRAAILPMLAESRVATEFDSQDALDKYLKDHPKADKSKHSIKKEEKKPKGEKGSKKEVGFKVDDKQLEARRPSLSDDLKQYGDDATEKDLKPEHREAIKEYNLEVVGHDAAQAVDIARKIKDGIKQGADICKMNPSVCEGNKGLTRDKMPQIEGDKTVKQMLDSMPDDAEFKDLSSKVRKAEAEAKKGDKPFELKSVITDEKKRKSWENRAKGEAMVQAGADPKSDKTIMAQMLDHFEKNGVKTVQRKAPVGMLKATQSEILADKTYGMADAYLKGKFNNIGDSVVVSRDGHILDGHHRWAALLTVDPSREMNVKVIDMDMDDLLKEAQSVPGVYKADFAGTPLVEDEQKKYKTESKTKFTKGKTASWNVQASFNREADAHREVQQAAVIRMAHNHPEHRSSLRNVLAQIKIDRAVRAFFTY